MRASPDQGLHRARQPERAPEPQPTDPVRHPSIRRGHVSREFDPHYAVRTAELREHQRRTPPSRPMGAVSRALETTGIRDWCTTRPIRRHPPPRTPPPSGATWTAVGRDCPELDPWCPPLDPAPLGPLSADGNGATSTDPAEASNSAIVYAGTLNGMYRSADGGRTWHLSNRGLRATCPPLVWPAPRRGSTLLANSASRRRCRVSPARPGRSHRRPGLVLSRGQPRSPDTGRNHPLRRAGHGAPTAGRPGRSRVRLRATRRGPITRWRPTARLRHGQHDRGSLRVVEPGRPVPATKASCAPPRPGARPGPPSPGGHTVDRTQPSSDVDPTT